MRNKNMNKSNSYNPNQKSLLVLDVLALREVVEIDKLFGAKIVNGKVPQIGSV